MPIIHFPLAVQSSILYKVMCRGKHLELWDSLNMKGDHHLLIVYDSTLHNQLACKEPTMYGCITYINQTQQNN